jgi:AcrR family transcriptional regulator
MQPRSEKTRAAIMTASAALFSQAGYDATSVAQICEQAGVSKGAFYHHFPSKQDVFLAILDEWLHDLDARLENARVKDETVPQSLLRMAETIGGVFRVAGGQLPMFMEFMVQASRDLAVWNAAIAPYRRYQQKFAELLAEGQREGSIRPDVNVQTAARVLISFAVGILLQGVVDPEAADWQAVTASGVQTFLKSIRQEQ